MSSNEELVQQQQQQNEQLQRYSTCHQVTMEDGTIVPIPLALGQYVALENQKKLFLRNSHLCDDQMTSLLPELSAFLMKVKGNVVNLQKLDPLFGEAGKMKWVKQTVRTETCCKKTLIEKLTHYAALNDTNMSAEVAGDWATRAVEYIFNNLKTKEEYKLQRTIKGSGTEYAKKRREGAKLQNLNELMN